ncbi:hypothetical protein AKJ09_09727 [Labilithrix luteola]|uniref:Uncharacterized protein n=1 Tax=Labilithrix luteola TaxID=1391654 RepID=A0A0K1QBD8_9BACT|nr:hypothetical protein AKJ09_09727 [Labilithrix luteola]
MRPPVPLARPNGGRFPVTPHRRLRRIRASYGARPPGAVR